MLVSRKQEWIINEERTPSVPAKVKPPINKNLRKKCLFVAAIMAIMAMLVTVQSEVIVRSGYGLVQLKEQAAALEKENELLRLEIAKLKSPQRIQDIAVNKLGMVAPQTMLYANTSNSKAQNASAGQDKTLGSQVISVLKPATAEASKGR